MAELENKNWLSILDNLRTYYKDCFAELKAANDNFHLLMAA
jgi:hypothetical protein